MNTKEAIGNAITELTKKNENIVVLTSDTVVHKKDIPTERQIPCGVSEQNMMGVAAGLALEGKIPFVVSFAAVTPSKNWDQLRLSVCYNKSNVKIISTDAGLSKVGEGGTQQALEDIALARSLPEMTVIAPANNNELKKAIIAAGIMKGPVYIRVGKDTVGDKTDFNVGKVEIMKAGKDCTIIACGAMVEESVKAAEKLLEQDIKCTVLNCHTIKPIDKHAIISSARLTGCVVTAEEHQIHGGLGSAVAEVLSEHAPVPIRIIGVKDEFGKSGKEQELYESYGLTHKNIMKAVKEVVLQRCTNVCTEIPEEHGRVLFDQIKPEYHFKLEGGGTIKSIPGLQKALLKMGNAVFSHHCNNHNNDFSTWIKDVFNEPALAKQIAKSKTPISMASAISRWIK